MGQVLQKIKSKVKEPSMSQSLSTGTKRAVVIGCNYAGTSAELQGAINDTQGIVKILTKFYGFSSRNIVLLSDGDKRYQKPVGGVIKRELIKAVQASKPGDVLFVHYSGHGTQVPTPPNPGNPNGLAQAIVPCDMNVILDDDLVQIFSNLPDGVHFTFIADCCHSGTLLNQPNVVLGGGGGSAMTQKLGNLGDIFQLKDLKGGIKIGSKGFKNRALKFEELTVIFNHLYGKLLGYTLGGNKDKNKGEEDPLQFHKGMHDVFGGDASSKSMGFLNIANQGVEMIQKQGLINQANANKAKQGIGNFNKMIGGKKENEAPNQQNQDAQPQTQHRGIGGKFGQMIGKKGNQKDQQGQQQDRGHHTNTKQSGSKDAQQFQGRGILVTGCSAKETSADACPSGNPKQAYGALSHALINIIKHHASQSRKPITSRELVIGVQEMLEKTGFNQHPQLEGAERDADRAFIIG